ncbi:MAG: aminotransferase class I/II-fold pyridoxal phosphate-dependent enzyme [Phycisphaerae bacterium]|nr:aminotransferase class I/II-fold pyridoxal phosphate-dependent enzyme [Phycisphaerae bacterium]
MSSASSAGSVEHPFVSRTSAVLSPFGSSVFTEMSLLARKHGAVNLGQGFPDFDGPDFLKEAAYRAIRDGYGQYSRSFGAPDLNVAIADRFARDCGLRVDPDAEITVTCGCTEAIAATLLGLVNPGDEVILIEPFYDSYPAMVAVAGGTVRPVTLRPPHFSLDVDALKAAVTSRTKAILVNTPHNPTGHVFRRAELEAIADLCERYNLICIADEVYDRLVFEGEHISIATLPGMRERTVTLSSLGKTFSFTGWKIGWAIAPAHLTAGVRAAHQFLTFCAATPLQMAAIEALRTGAEYDRQFIAEYRARRELLVGGLKEAGFEVFAPEGTYFVMCDHSRFGFEDDLAFCRFLVREIGVAAIPPGSFYCNRSEGRKLVRFAFCKRDETLNAAIERMRPLRSRLRSD